MIKHLCSKHNTETIEYRELELDLQTDQFGYRSKMYTGVIPGS